MCSNQCILYPSAPYEMTEMKLKYEGKLREAFNAALPAPNLLPSGGWFLRG